MEQNPYIPPSSSQPVQIVAADPELLAIRNEHLRTEFCVQVLGWLYACGGILAIIGAVIGEISGLLGIGLQESATGGYAGFRSIARLVLFVAGGVVALFTGLGLRRFRPWARVVTIVLIFVSLALNLMSGFSADAAVSLIVYCLLLFFLFRARTRMIFTEDYREVMAGTVGVRYRGHLRWIFPLVLVILVLLPFAIALAAWVKWAHVPEAPTYSP